MQESDIEVDENGTLDLSMKKTKREGMQSPEPSSSSSSSSQHVGAVLSQVHTQSDWDSPLDFTKSSEVKEEDHEEVPKKKLPFLCWEDKKNTTVCEQLFTHEIQI